MNSLVSDMWGVGFVFCFFQCPLSLSDKKEAPPVGSVRCLAHFGRHGPGLSPDPLLVLGPVLAIAGVGLGLGRILDVGVVEQVLDAEKQLFDGDGRPPILLLVQEREADRTRRIYIGVEKRWRKLHFGRSRGVVVLEDHLAPVHAPVPRRGLLAGNPVLPKHEIHGAVRILGGPGNEPEGVVFAPILALLGQSGLRDSRHDRRVG